MNWTNFLLDAITRQVSASIENQYLNNQAIEKEKMEQELNVAASIQQRILPTDITQNRRIMILPE